MIRADYNDKDRMVNILANSFADNKSINYIIKQDKKKAQRLISLMEYSFDICYLFGDIFLSDDKKACALIVMPDKKKTTLKSILLDAKMIISCMGFKNIKKAVKREAEIKQNHPEGLIYYLWFIGVEVSEQSKGTGSKLLEEVIQESQSKGRPVYLETSTVKNIPWYEKSGFTVYKELDFGYKLYCLKRE